MARPIATPSRAFGWGSAGGDFSGTGLLAWDRRLAFVPSLPTCWAACVAAIAAVALAAFLPARAVAAPRVQFRDFNCANLWPCRLSRPDRWRQLGLGMARYDVAWPSVQPRQGEWEWDGSDAALAELADAGVSVVVMLGYTPGWACVQQEYSFVEAGHKWEVLLQPFDSVAGYRPARVRRTRLSDGSVHEGRAGNLPPRRVSDWQRYVDRTVSRYVKPPFSVRYFQIWNEFNWPEWYHQTWRDFIDRIHIPAARIIRGYGAKVVFGGWACTSSAHELCRLLEYRDAWKYTDIIDFHYQVNHAFQVVWERFVRTGRCQGIWETEVGWVAWKEYLINTYPRLLYWALKHDWTHPDKYKVFWFHFSSVSALHGLTYQDKPDQPLSRHGRALRVLANTLPGPIRPWDGYATRPPLPFALKEEAPSSEGFATRSSIVVVCHLPDGSSALGTGRLSITLAPQAGTVIEAQAWDRAGRSLRVESKEGRTYLVHLDGCQPETWRFEARGVTVVFRALVR